MYPRSRIPRIPEKGRRGEWLLLIGHYNIIREGELRADSPKVPFESHELCENIWPCYSHSRRLPRPLVGEVCISKSATLKVLHVVPYSYRLKI